MTWPRAHRHPPTVPAAASKGATGSAGWELAQLLPGEDRRVGDGLFVDLVPSSCWFTNVRSCVAPGDWQRLRRMVLERARQRCETCGRGAAPEQRQWLEVHERWAYDAARRVQALRRLICLCSACHQSTHFGRAQVTGHAEQAFAHLQSVTGMSAVAARQHIAAAFRLWAARNAVSWSLDLSILDGTGIALRPPPAAQDRAAVAAAELRALGPLS